MQSDPQLTFGQLLRKLRGSQSQKLVADRAGIGQRYYSDLERGKARNPSREVLKGLANAFSVDYESLAMAAWHDQIPMTEPLTTGELPPAVIGELAKLWLDLTPADQEAILEHTRALAERRQRQREPSS